ncbi:hypothetical protein [Chrysiogenes arsenatis]|uniref:hypothetical protein n=1 Tax=Chrysiogenes arsenatis TaxID=309797 RepID=UPI00041E55A4|nr:hypothetical protein [Chrysiogenes arsenatis]
MNTIATPVCRFRRNDSLVERFGFWEPDRITPAVGSLFYGLMAEPHTHHSDEVTLLPALAPQNILLLDEQHQPKLQKSFANLTTANRVKAETPATVHAAIICGGKCGVGSSLDFSLFAWTWCCDLEFDGRVQMCARSFLLGCTLFPIIAGKNIAVGIADNASAHGSISHETIMPILVHLVRHHTFFPGDMVAFPLFRTLLTPHTTRWCAGEHQWPAI